MPAQWSRELKLREFNKEPPITWEFSQRASQRVKLAAERRLSLGERIAGNSVGPVVRSGHDIICELLNAFRPWVYRWDYKPTEAPHRDLRSINILAFTRSWFQNPNSFDNVLHTYQTDSSRNPLGPTDQRSQIRTFNVAPSWTRLLSNNAVFTLGGFVRHDQYNYYPSSNLFDDLSPIQQETVAQGRTLTNAGLRTALSYAKGAHNLKVGATYQQTFLNENDNIGIVDNELLPSLTDENGSSCFVNAVAVGSPCTDLLPFDLTRRGGLFAFRGHTDVKQLALYIQDQITKGSWSFNVGLRGDFHNGLTTHKEAQPRLGIAYNIKKTNTVLRVSTSQSARRKIPGALHDIHASCRNGRANDNSCPSGSGIWKYRSPHEASCGLSG